ncbi:heparan sulfate 2-O-sulfotransferase 1-like isoform X2 [Dendronephthya gigantea]|uniref:heparan sulfate 2-O-sulfotransferase 1-like isoform X2 n=1 Tax=Dendronephthya gigantea TaxID=151771 RepID=UPI00106C8A0A|nr:heparan sulfate 2-O-sulfotransferase 1-like isoform X2 [Dendronephthya gigantea]XP_028412133.1 heparan sulfate 2-O-sulfotransferase 1-like isoform X2 [Dendronephthya gigantea]
MFRPRKCHLAGIFMLSMLGIMFYFHFPWDYIEESLLSESQRFRETKSVTSATTYEPKGIVINKQISFQNFEDSKSLGKTKNIDVLEIQNIVKIKRRKYRLPKRNRSSTQFWNKTIASKYLINVSDHSCEPLYPQVVLYNRIFKTASTTMTSFLENCSKSLNYGILKEATEEWSNQRKSHPILQRIQSKAYQDLRERRRHLAISHFYFRINSGLKMKHTYINLLREPVERFISHYYYVRSPNRWGEKLRKLKALGHWNVTLEQCIENQYEGCKWNTMTRFFCGPDTFCQNGTSQALSQAKANMFRYYCSIGLVEYLNEFTAVLHKRLPNFISKYHKIIGKKFVTVGVERKPISDSVMAKLRMVNNADIELYNYAKTLFLKQAEQCGIKIK